MLGSCLDVQEVIFSPPGVPFIVDETIKSLLRYLQSTVEIQGDATWGEVWLPSEQGAAKPCMVPLPRFKWLETFEKGGASSGDWKPAEVLDILSPEGGRRGRRDPRGPGERQERPPRVGGERQEGPPRAGGEAGETWGGGEGRAPMELQEVGVVPWAGEASSQGLRGPFGSPAPNVPPFPRFLEASSF